MTAVLEELDRLIAQTQSPLSTGNPNDLLTVGEVGEWAKMPSQQVYLLPIPRTKVGGRVRFMRKHVLSYLRKMTQFPPGWKEG